MGMLMVNALYYDEVDDPKRRFNPEANAKQNRCWLNPDDERVIEYALGVLRASHDRALETWNRVEETLPVFVRFWPDRPGIGPHGVVHTGCNFSRNMRVEDWAESENVHNREWRE